MKLLGKSSPLIIKLIILLLHKNFDTLVKKWFVSHGMYSMHIASNFVKFSQKLTLRMFG